MLGVIRAMAVLACLYLLVGAAQAQPPDKALADQFHLDIFSESSQGLFEYNPANKSDTQLADNLQWINPCQYK